LNFDFSNDFILEDQCILYVRVNLTQEVLPSSLHKSENLTLAAPIFLLVISYDSVACHLLVHDEEVEHILGVFRFELEFLKIKKKLPKPTRVVCLLPRGSRF